MLIEKFWKRRELVFRRRGEISLCRDVMREFEGRARGDEAAIFSPRASPSTRVSKPFPDLSDPASQNLS